MTNTIEKETVVRKIAQILKITEDKAATQSEKDTACAKAMLLARKYDIELRKCQDAMKEAEEFCGLITDIKCVPAHSHLFLVIATFLSRKYGILCIQKYRNGSYYMMLHGRPSQVEIASVIATALARQWRAAYTEATKPRVEPYRSSGMRYKVCQRSFYKGCYAGLMQKIEQEKATQTASDRAEDSGYEIVLVRQCEQIQKWFLDKNPAAKKIATRRSNIDGTSYHKGVAVGQTTTMQEAIK